MLVAAQIEEPEDGERRSAGRIDANAMAKVRQLKQPPVMIHVVDISPEGCGFRSKWPLPAETRVLLSLPGLEVWLATVAWFEEGKGGLRFDRPLHPAVAKQYAAAPAQPSPRPAA